MNEIRTPLVPEKTYAICTNGLKKGYVSVVSQKTVGTSSKGLLATEVDKVINCACVYSGILVAAVAAFFMAAACTGVGAVLAGMLIAAAIGTGAAFCLQGLVCRIFMKPMWQPVHPRIKIVGNKALIGTSKTICVLPIPLTAPGNIILVYDKKVANRWANKNMVRNLGKILGGAMAGFGARGLVKMIAGTFAESGLVTTITKTSITVGGGYVGGMGTNLLKEGISSWAIQLINPVNKDANEYLEESYYYNEAKIIQEKSFVEMLPSPLPLGAANAFQVKDDVGILSTKHKIEPTYQSGVATESQRYNSQEIAIEKQYGTKAQILEDNKSVTKKIVMENYNKNYRPNGRGLSEAWADYKKDINNYADQRMDEKQKMSEENTTQNKNKIRELEEERARKLKNAEDSKKRMKLLGWTFLADAISDMAGRWIENSFINDFKTLQELEKKHKIKQAYMKNKFSSKKTIG